MVLRRVAPLGPRSKPVPPASAGAFFITGLPGKPLPSSFRLFQNKLSIPLIETSGYACSLKEQAIMSVFRPNSMVSSNSAPCLCILGSSSPSLEPVQTGCPPPRVAEQPLLSSPHGPLFSPGPFCSVRDPGGPFLTHFA